MKPLNSPRSIIRFTSYSHVQPFIDLNRLQIIAGWKVRRFHQSSKVRSDESRKDPYNGSRTITPQLILSLKKQAIANSEASYDSLPPITSGFDQISIKNPKSFLKPRIHITSLPKLAMKLTKSAKKTDAYGINFGIMPRPTTPPKVDDANQDLKDPSTPSPVSLIDQALKFRSMNQNRNRIESLNEPTTKTKDRKTEFGSSNHDPSCHNASSPLLAISHKKLQKLADLINRYQMTVEQAILQMRFSHKAIASKVLELLLKAKQDAIDRGFKSDRLIIAEAWVTKGFHTSELQVRARGRHGRITHPTAKFCLVLRQSPNLSKLALKRELELKASKRRLTQRGTIAGSPIRLPADGVLPTSVSQQVHWGW